MNDISTELWWKINGRVSFVSELFIFEDHFAMQRVEVCFKREAFVSTEHSLKKVHEDNTSLEIQCSILLNC